MGERDDAGMTPLHRAAAAGQCETATLLLGQGGAVDARDDEGSTPLYFASCFGKAGMVRLLLARGADVNAANLGRYTALLAACENGHAEVVKVLLDHGANVNTVSRTQGITPMKAAQAGGHDEIVALLTAQAGPTHLSAAHHADSGAQSPQDPADSVTLQWAPFVTTRDGRSGDDLSGRELTDEVIESFRTKPVVSVRIVCVYSTQCLYEITGMIEAEQRDNSVPTGFQVHAIQGADPAAKRGWMEEALRSISQLPDRGWEPGATSILVVITDADGAFAKRVSALPLARRFVLFFGYRADVVHQVRRKLESSTAGQAPNPARGSSEGIGSPGGARCRECATEVADDAEGCVHCGAWFFRRGLQGSQPPANGAAPPEFSSIRGGTGSMIVKTPPRTGDAYVDSCFEFDFEEFDESRVWHEIASIKEIPFVADTDTRRALELAESALDDYRDYSFVYYWIGKLRGQLSYPGEPRTTYLEGLRMGRNKPMLCGGIAVSEFDRGNLSEAVKWWIKSCAIQLSCGLSRDGFSFLNLAYVAQGLKLAQYKTPLIATGQDMQSIDFDSFGANQRILLAHEQGTASIKSAVSLLCDFYMSKSTSGQAGNKKSWRFWK
jgi:hypothetical protein